MTSTLRQIRHGSDVGGRRAALAPLALSIAVALLAGCGGSSKPSYCSAVTNLESSIKALPSTNIVQNGTSALKSAVSKVQTDANAVVSDAKNDFPSETDALKSSVNALAGTVTTLASSPTAATAAQLPGEISAVATSVKSFTSATSSKCG